MRSVFCALAIVILAFPRFVDGQTSSPTEIGCSLPTDSEQLQITLPLEVLDQLERLRSSSFVHAFLIRQIAAPAAGFHRLSKCARAFVNSSPTDMAALRQNLPDQGAIIDALRSAELTRRRIVELTDSGRTLSAVVTSLKEDPSPANLDAFGKELNETARAKCKQRSDPCSLVVRAAEQVDGVRESLRVLDAKAAAARQTAEEAARATQAVLVASTAKEEIASRIAQLTAADGSTTDAAARRELTLQHDEASKRTTALSIERDTLVNRATDANKAHLDAAADTKGRQGRLINTLADLESRLRRPGQQHGIAVAKIDRPQISAQVAAIAAALQPPPMGSGVTTPRVRSANLTLELTDFIVARMRREAVNALVVNFHNFARAEPMLRYGFPDTWGLMSAVALRSDSTLNALDVGRIPLNTWRATLAGDFVKLPAHLLVAGSAAICRNSQGADTRESRVQRGRSVPETRTGRRENTVARPVELTVGDECRERVDALRPLGTFATRLLEGESVIMILREAGNFAPAQSSGRNGVWRHISEGLTIVASLAETYLAQGHVPSADPVQHPYILTAASLAHMPKEQRDAFARLLLVRAVSPTSDLPSSIDVPGLYDATVTVIQLLERIESRQAAPEQRPGDAVFLVRSGFEALNESVAIAKAVAPPQARPRLDTLSTRWRSVSGTIEAIAAKNFGLAFSRTAVLLRELRGVEVSGPVLMFAGLASSLSEAQDGDQVRRAFEAAASPPGGWQAKRYGQGGGSITAFPGMAFGLERVLLKKADDASLKKSAAAVGASLPIGMEFQSKWVGENDCAGPVCGLGLFLPVIDLGALLSYRFGGADMVESEPNPNLRQVFAPGAYLSLALTRTVPVNLLMGGQLMPSLRTVTTPEGTARRSTVRLGVGLGMDILLFGF